MKQILNVLILTTLISCGRSGSRLSKTQEENPIRPCGSGSVRSLCIEPVNYIMNTRLSNLSKNIRMDVLFKKEDGSEEGRFSIINTCERRGDLKIISSSTGSSIFFTHDPFLNAKSSLEIVDLGGDCKGNTVVIKTDLTTETFRVEVSTRTVNVDLD